MKAAKKERLPAEAPSTPSEYTTGWRLPALVLALGMAIFLVAVDTTIVSTAIPAISTEFQSVSSNGWYGSAFFLTNAAAQSSWGKIYRYLLLKATFVSSMALFEVGSLICALAQNPATLIVGRALAGAGAAGVVSGAYTILAVSAAPKIRSALTAIFGVSYAVASFVGPLLGGAFTSATTWRWCFWINLPVGGVTLVIVLLIFNPPSSCVPEPASWQSILKQLDLLGVVLFITAMTCYLLALEWGGGVKTWGDADVIGTLTAAGIIALLFCLQQWFMHDSAMIPRGLLLTRSMTTHCAVIFFLAPAFFILLYYLPIYFQVVRGLSATASGVRTVPLVLACGFLSALSGIYMSALGYGLPPMLLGSASTAIACGVLYRLSANSSSAFWIGLQVLSGTGVGIACQVPMIVNQATAAASDLSSATGLTLFFQMTGGALFLQLAQCLLNNKLGSYLGAHLDASGQHVDPRIVLGAGAAGIAEMFGADELGVVLGAYMAGLRVTFVLGAVLAGVATVISGLTGMRSIKGQGQGQSAGDGELETSRGS
ncbi:hypothetical protein BDW74DRAFT_180454 [Aspergillus multicolor]|uniref:uncharacterized protein n=1 Tax=Aspergillus multicolor TaxID=41759 RepID=UPI003CCDADFB